VRLESKKNCYIATINKVIQTGKYYLILDKTQSRLFVFDTLGTFQHTIGHRGIGPESFRDITSIAFINNKQHIIIHSNRDMALFIYSIEGKLLQRNKIDFFAHQMCKVNNNVLVFYVNNYNPAGYNLIYTDIKGKIIHQASPISKDMPEQAFSFIGGLSQGNGYPLFSEIKSNTIARISDTVLQPIYNINISNNQLSTNSDKTALNQILNFHIDFFHNTFSENKKALYLKYQIGHQLYKAVYSKKTKKLYTKGNFVHNYMYEFFRHLSCPLGFTLDGAFISCLNADRAIRLKNLEKDLQNSHSDKERLVKKVLNKMDETSNPILIIYDFK
jgi:hypothetical protein